MILLARHGQTDENAAGAILGRRDPSLSARGRRDAAALAAAVADAEIAVVYCSPLARAHETAAIVAAELDLPAPIVLDRLIESRRGDWEGQTYTELRRSEPDLLARFEAGDPAFAFPGGESTAEQTARTRAALELIAAGPLPALAVTHAGTIRAALALAGRAVPPERALGHGETFRF